MASRRASVVLALSLMMGALAVSLASLSACTPHAPRTPYATGEPVPTATTSAEPLWLRNRP